MATARHLASAWSSLAIVWTIAVVVVGVGHSQLALAWEWNVWPFGDGGGDNARPRGVTEAEESFFAKLDAVDEKLRSVKGSRVDVGFEFARDWHQDVAARREELQLRNDTETYELWFDDATENVVVGSFRGSVNLEDLANALPHHIDYRHIVARQMSRRTFPHVRWAAGQSPRLRRQHVDRSFVDIYADHVARLMERYPSFEELPLLIIDARRAGWGNKMRHILGCFKLCLAIDRVCLIEAGSLNLDVVFEEPWPMLFSNLTYLGNPPRSVSPVFSWEHDQRFGNMLMSTTIEEFYSSVMSIGGYSSMEVSIDSRIEYRTKLNQLGITPNKWQFGTEVLSSLLSRPTPALQQSVAELKNVTSFDDSKYKLRVCMHLRVGVDAGEEFEWSAAQYHSAYRCSQTAVREWRRQHNATSEETLFYVASDHPPLRRNVAYELSGDADVVYDSRHNEGFTQTDTQRDAEKMLNVISEWYLLGECDYILSSGTTFSIFAGQRTNTPVLSFTAYGKPLDLCHYIVNLERYVTLETRTP